jgi:hypothetical protein
MSCPTTAIPPGTKPTEPGWYVAEDDGGHRHVVQIIPCSKGLYVFETDAVDTFPLDGYDPVIVARLDLAGMRAVTAATD